MVTQTEIEMKNRETKVLEKALVDAAKALIRHTESRHYLIPYQVDSGAIHYVVVGNHMMMPGLFAQARKNAGARK